MPINRILSPGEDKSTNIDSVLRRIFPKFHKTREELVFFTRLLYRVNAMPFSTAVLEGIPKESLADPNKKRLMELYDDDLEELKIGDEDMFAENAQYWIVPYSGKKVTAVTPLYIVEHATVVYAYDGPERLRALRYDHGENTFMDFSTQSMSLQTLEKITQFGYKNLLFQKADPLGVSTESIASARNVVRAQSWRIPRTYSDTDYGIPIDETLTINSLHGYYELEDSLSDNILPNMHLSVRSIIINPDQNMQLGHRSN